MLEGRLRATVPFFFRSLWRGFVLMIVVDHVLSQSEQCASSGDCILPVPRKQSEGKSLESLLLEVQCYLGCVDQFGGSLSVTDGGTQWPTVDFSAFQSDCTRYYKVRECKEGCLQKAKDESSGVNRCRDDCYTSCLEERDCSVEGSCTQSQQSVCPRSCRKTYCRFGCEVYNTIHGSTSSSFVRHPAQSTLSPSAITPVPRDPGQVRSWLYTLDTRTPLLYSARNKSQPNPNRVLYSLVAYIVKVSTADDDHKYYWQKNSVQPLDFSPLACSAVSISFSVISKYRLQGGHPLTFSPTSSLCLPGVGGYPNQLLANSIRAAYTEDTRAEFLGYAVSVVSWSKPNNSQYLTSYTIRVYPDEERCGGTTDTYYTFRNIDKELTEFTLKASTNNGLWKFGCTYLIEVVALPTEMPINTISGGFTPSTTELTNRFPPFELNCSRVWNDRGQFSIAVSWSFPSSTQLSHIRRFIVVPKLTLKANDLAVELYDKSSLYITNDEQKKFSASTQIFTPFVNPDKRYLIEVKAEKNSQYTWRRLPMTQLCTVPATPLPPGNISEVSVTMVGFDEEDRRLQLQVGVAPPNDTHGMLQQYEVVLRKSLAECLDCNDSGILRLLSDSSPVIIDATLDTNYSGHCLFLNARVFNSYNLSSHWSRFKVIALDENCDSSSYLEATEGGHVTVYYESEGTESTKVLEFGCRASLLDSQYVSSERIETRLQAISDRLGTRYRSDQEQDINLETKLRQIEEKLDIVLESLGRQAHEGT